MRHVVLVRQGKIRCRTSQNKWGCHSSSIASLISLAMIKRGPVESCKFSNRAERTEGTTNLESISLTRDVCSAVPSTREYPSGGSTPAFLGLAHVWAIPRTLLRTCKRVEENFYAFVHPQLFKHSKFDSAMSIAIKSLF